MKNLKTAFLYGLGVWAVPFIGGMVIYPLRLSDLALFESLIAVILALATVIFGVKFVRQQKTFGLLDAYRTGLFWIIICILPDLFFFVWGPVQMPLVSYIKDIAATYLMIPIILSGLALAKKS